MRRSCFPGRAVLSAGRTPLHDVDGAALAVEIRATEGWTLLGSTARVARPGCPPGPWTIVAETPAGRRVTIGSRERWQALRDAHDVA